jgi:hypothetical protein
MLDVGETPVPDAISYLIYQYGMAVADDVPAPEEWVEQVVLDVITRELDENGVPWRLVESHVELGG